MKDAVPPSTPEEGAKRVLAAVVKVFDRKDGTGAEWLDSWQVSYDGQPPQPEALDEYRDCTITEKLHYLILREKMRP